MQYKLAETADSWIVPYHVAEAFCLGMMRLCLHESIAWARERTTFGKPLIEHQVVRHKLVEMSSRIDARGA